MSVQNVSRKSGDLTDLPVIVLVTRAMKPETLEPHPDLEQLFHRFEFRLAASPQRALALSRDLLTAGGQVVLLLSDMLSSGTRVHAFISAFSQYWPDAGFHLIDTVGGRVIFSEPSGPSPDRPPSIRIESNGRETLDGRLVSRMVERYFPENGARRPKG